MSPTSARLAGNPTGMRQVGIWRKTPPRGHASRASARFSSRPVKSGSTGLRHHRASHGEAAERGVDGGSALELFGKRAHVEIIKRSSTITLLAINRALRPKDLQLIWSAARGPHIHESTKAAIYGCLVETSRELDEDQLIRLLDRVGADVDIAAESGHASGDGQVHELDFVSRLAYTADHCSSISVQVLHILLRMWSSAILRGADSNASEIELHIHDLVFSDLGLQNKLPSMICERCIECVKEDASQDSSNDSPRQQESVGAEYRSYRALSLLHSILQTASAENSLRALVSDLLANFNLLELLVSDLQACYGELTQRSQKMAQENGSARTSDDCADATSVTHLQHLTTRWRLLLYVLQVQCAVANNDLVQARSRDSKITRSNALRLWGTFVEGAVNSRDRDLALQFFSLLVPRMQPPARQLLHRSRVCHYRKEDCLLEQYAAVAVMEGFLDGGIPFTSFDDRAFESFVVYFRYLNNSLQLVQTQIYHNSRKDDDYAMIDSIVDSERIPVGIEALWSLVERCANASVVARATTFLTRLYVDESMHVRSANTVEMAASLSATFVKECIRRLSKHSADKMDSLPFVRCAQVLQDFIANGDSHVRIRATKATAADDCDFADYTAAISEIVAEESHFRCLHSMLDLTSEFAMPICKLLLNVPASQSTQSKYGPSLTQLLKAL